MPELFVYLIQVNAALALFYLAYRFLLRRLTFYTLNRYFLLFGFVFSALYPLAGIRQWLSPAPQHIPDAVYLVVPDWQAVQSAPFSIWPYLQLIFWAVLGFFAVRLILRLLSLWRLHRSSAPATWQYFHFRHVIHQIDPFTFWKNIYVHVESHPDQELQEIFYHEQVHVEQLHTMDTLLAEFYTLFCWFNPASWLLRAAVRENLEFVTDRQVLRSGVDKRSYQYSLLNLSTSGAPDELVSHFNLKHLKNRIMMMNKKRSSFAHLSKYLVGLPLIVLLATVFTLSKAQEAATDQDNTPAVQPFTVAVQPEEPLAVEVPSDESEEPAEAAQHAEPVESSVSAPIPVARRVIGRPMAERTKVAIGGDPTAQGALNKLKGDMIRVQGRAINILSDTSNLTDTGERPTVQMPYYVRIDGEEGNLNSLDPDRIQSITIVKGERAALEFGAVGQHGVIQVTTKK